MTLSSLGSAGTGSSLATGAKEAEVPIVPLIDAAIFPALSFPLEVNRRRSLLAVEESRDGDQVLGIFTQLNSKNDEPDISDLHRTGIAVEIESAVEGPEGGLIVIIKGVCRIRLLELVHAEPYLRARVEVLEDQGVGDIELASLVTQLRQAVDRAVKSNRIRSGWRVTEYLDSYDNPAVVSDVVAAHLNLSSADQQELLETLHVRERLQKVISLTRIAAPLEAETKLSDKGREEAIELAMAQARDSYRGGVKPNVRLVSTFVVGFALVLLVAWGVMKTPVGNEDMLSLRDSCASVRAGMSPASLIGHLDKGIYRPRCLPSTQDCTEFASKEGEQHHFACPGGQCSMYWDRGEWTCRVALGGKDLRALGPGKLLVGGKACGGPDPLDQQRCP